MIKILSHQKLSIKKFEAAFYWKTVAQNKTKKVKQNLKKMLQLREEIGKTKREGTVGEVEQYLGNVLETNPTTSSSVCLETLEIEDVEEESKFK